MKTALGVFLSIAGYKLFDLIETKIDIGDEIKKGNVAAAILAAASP